MFRRRRASRAVTLRLEDDGEDFRRLTASVTRDGALKVEGHDLGPGTAIVSPDGEYEWVTTVAAAHVGRLVVLLGGREGDDVLDVLDVLERSYTGAGSHDFERILRESDIPVERWTRS